MSLLNQILYRIPLITTEFKDEVSETVTEKGFVAKKSHRNASVQLESFCGLFNLPKDYPEENTVIFETDSGVKLHVNNKDIFNKFNEGNKVNLDYVECYTAKYNFQPPNFDKKVLINKHHEHYKLISVN